MRSRAQTIAIILSKYKKKMGARGRVFEAKSGRLPGNPGMIFPHDGGAHYIDEGAHIEWALKKSEEIGAVPGESPITTSLRHGYVRFREHDDEVFVQMDITHEKAVRNVLRTIGRDWKDSFVTIEDMHGKTITANADRMQAQRKLRDALSPEVRSKLG
jgi:hypothetical protein